MKIHAFAAMAAKENLLPFDYEPKSLAPDDIEIKITHCGICHSDIHLIDNDWSVSNFPLIPGHEIIGTVTEIGSSVKHLEKGQRVGVGWQCSSCFDCEWCNQGIENLCFSQRATCVQQYGGYAEKIRTDGRFAFPIPESLDSEKTAPLFCGGATVYSPIKQYVKGPKTKMAIIGLGGLGHMAVQIAKAFGCEITVISTSPDKEIEAKKLGADFFLLGSNIQQANNTFDFILNTVSAELNYQPYFDLLRPQGTFCLVGMPCKNVPISDMSLVTGRRHLCGSNIASRSEIKELLELAARHKIAAITECFLLKDVNKALDKVRSNKVHYRAVLKM